MTSSHEEETLRQLFIELEHMRKKTSFSRMTAFDNFAMVCLRITSMLVSDVRLTKIIGRHLSLIIKAPKAVSAINDLHNGFIHIENDLEEGLRGFSNLLDWVLEENTVRRCPSSMLDDVEGIDENVAKTFTTLALVTMIYFDLVDAFQVHFEKTLALIFLTALRDLYDDITGDTLVTGENAVSLWLEQRVKDGALLKLFIKAQHEENFGQQHHVGQELIVLKICYRLVENRPLTKIEFPSFDRALQEVGMVGVMPLFHAGFLSIEDEIPILQVT